MDLKKSPSWAMDTRRKHPLYLLANAAPKAPRPQGPKIQLGPASRPSSQPFRKITAVPQVPSGAVLTGEVKVLLDQRGSSSNGSKPWKQHQPASFWTQPATILHIYIYCVIECVRCKTREIYIYNYNYIIIYIYTSYLNLTIQLVPSACQSAASGSGLKGARVCWSRSKTARRGPGLGAKKSCDLEKKMGYL